MRSSNTPDLAAPVSTTAGPVRSLSVRVAGRLLAVALAMVVGLVLAEAGLRVIGPESRAFYVFVPGTRVEFHPLTAVFPGITGSSSFTTNSLGFRGSEPPSGGPPPYRILALGGSTTECLYLDDTETWPFLLQRLLGKTSDGRPVWVGNAGKSGLNSRDHVVQLKHLLPQLAPPDVVLVLAGVNDLTARLARGTDDAPAGRMDEAGHLNRAFARVPGRLHEAATAGVDAGSVPWFQRTALHQLLKRANALLGSADDRRRRQDVEGRTLETWRSHRRQAPVSIDRPPELGTALDEYSRNLETIVDVARGRGADVIFMTQPMLWRRDLELAGRALLWMGGLGDFQKAPGQPYYSVGALADAMARYNQRMLQVCAARGLHCLDLAARVPRTTEIFYDDAHFTELGARLIAEIVAEHLARGASFRAGGA